MTHWHDRLTKGTTTPEKIATLFFLLGSLGVFALLFYLSIIWR